MKTILFLTAILLGRVSMASVPVGCHYTANTLGHTLEDLTHYYYVVDPNDAWDLQAALHDKNCLKTIEKTFFIPNKESSFHSLEKQQDFLREMLLEMGDDIKHIPLDVFSGLDPENDCKALAETTKYRDVGPLLWNHLTGPQVKAFPEGCEKLFSFPDLAFGIAQRDLLHWSGLCMKALSPVTMGPAALRYAPKTWVELRFNAAVCSRLHHGQLATLGSDINDLALKGAKGINRECLMTIEHRAWEGLRDAPPNGTTLKAFLEQIPPTSFRALSTTLPAYVKDKLSQEQIVELNKIVLNPCPNNILANSLEQLTYNTDVRSYAISLMKALGNGDCAATITRDFFVTTEDIDGGPSVEEQQKYLGEMLRRMGENVEHIPSTVFRSLDPGTGECDALAEVTKDKAVAELLGKNLRGEQLQAIPVVCAKHFSRELHFELAQRNLFWPTVFYRRDVYLEKMSFETLEYAPKRWVQKDFNATVCKVQLRR